MGRLIYLSIAEKQNSPNDQVGKKSKFLENESSKCAAKQRFWKQGVSGMWRSKWRRAKTAYPINGRW
jgi:hypothetical protein